MSSQKLVSKFLELKAIKISRIIIATLKERLRVRLFHHRLPVRHRNKCLLRCLLQRLSDNLARRAAERRLRLYSDFFCSIRRMKAGCDRLIAIKGQKQRMKLVHVKAVLLWKFRRLILGMKALRSYRSLCEERRSILLKAKADFQLHFKRVIARVLLLKAVDEASRRRSPGHDLSPMRRYFDLWKRNSAKNGSRGKHKCRRKVTGAGDVDSHSKEPPREVRLPTQATRMSSRVDPRSGPRHRIQSSSTMHGKEVSPSSDLTILEKRKLLAGEILALVSQLRELKSHEISQR